MSKIETENQEESLSESFKLLQEHGITMLPNDENNILSSVMESGHSVVLTEVGKEVLNTMKMLEPDSIIPKHVQKKYERRKVITVTPEEFLEMTTNCSATHNNSLKQINGKTVQTVKPTVKRIVMKKNKTSPISNSTNVST